MIEAIILGAISLLGILVKAYLNHRNNAAIDAKLEAMEREAERQREEKRLKDEKEAAAVTTVDDAADFLRDSFN